MKVLEGLSQDPARESIRQSTIHSALGQEVDFEDADPEERDIEAENELIQGVSGDPLAAYDVDVHEEGKAIQDYLDKIVELQGLDG